ncbi:MAG: diguanylate cyclase [Anaerolineae bacterium]|nr:diguanylate cyclase [Anaerolineae bacterium]
MRILVVEDDNAMRMLLKRAVEKFGHECLVAEDGAQAWDIYQHTTINVVISDRVMPGMDGIELCRRIRETPQNGYTYFIFLSAMSERSDAFEGLQAGADDYLTKPFVPDDLRARLLVAARITELHRQLLEQQAELKRLNQELFEQGRRDPLTHLGNRLRLMEDLVVIIGQAERYDKRYCAVLCDVDHFKAYNDFYGHLAGDEVLQKVAQTIVKNCRNGDAAYRFGGEEFLLILPEQTEATAVIAAERLRKMIEALGLPHQAKTPPGVVTISVGVAALEPGDYKAPHLWLKRADDALYRAKRDGRNCVRRAGELV